jgi:two-component system sensor histidine kinase QseC
VAAVLIGLALLLYVGARRAAWRQYDDVLAAHAHAIAASAEHDADGYDIAIPTDPRGAPATYAEAWKPDGHVLARSSTLTTDLPVALAASEVPVVADLTLADGRRGRAVAFRFTPHEDDPKQGSEQMSVVLAEGTESVDASLRSVRKWFIAAAVAALLLVAAATAYFLARGLRPLAALAERLERIDDRNLATRLPIREQPEELAGPVRKLNELLARLEASFARERQFSADVGHELRTPLAGLRMLLEVTQLADRSGDDYRKALADALETVRQLATVVESLMTLARLDAGQIDVELEDVELAALVEECWRPHARLAASRGIEFRNRVELGTTAKLDRDKLRIVLGNLLANAAEYTAHGGWVEVTHGSTAMFDVTDSGPPIPPEQLAHVFERMWRGDAARAATGIHCGIGLALSRALCERLELSLTAASRPDGCVSFRVV